MAQPDRLADTIAQHESQYAKKHRKTDEQCHIMAALIRFSLKRIFH
ncbi:MAG: hypothetical protein ACI4WX_05165 [Aristaeellaceae bacterium]